MSGEEPALVVALSGDLFFTSRIESAARRMGRWFAAARSVAELRGALAPGSAALVLIDLSGAGLDVDGAVAAARSLGVRDVVAFGPHRDLDARTRALAAGCDRWLPNSRLAAELPELLQHGPGPPTEG